MKNQHTNIDSSSVAYSALKGYVDFCFKRFYKLRYTNKESINPNDTVIFACNHQNALMDALALLSAFKWQPVFLARSDIFRQKTVARILRFLKILPVYRIRDGFDQLANNNQVFEQTFSVLDNHNPIALFPEGNHVGQRKLRTLKKGIARIAFNYRHQNPGHKKDIKIIATGLNYAHYHKPGSELLIRFNAPIFLSDFDNSYALNQAKAVNQFMSELDKKLKEIILHIEEDSSTIEFIIDLYAAALHREGEAAETVFQRQKQLIIITENLKKQQPERFSELETEVKAIRELLQANYLCTNDIALTKDLTSYSKLMEYLKLLITFPAYIYAFLQNLIPWWVLNNLLLKFKDPHFKSSVFLVGTILIYPIIHALQTLVFYLISGSSVLSIAYFISLPISYIFKTWWDNKKGILKTMGNLSAIAGPLQKHLAYINRILNL